MGLQNSSSLSSPGGAATDSTYAKTPAQGSCSEDQKESTPITPNKRSAMVFNKTYLAHDKVAGFIDSYISIQ